LEPFGFLTVFTKLTAR